MNSTYQIYRGAANRVRTGWARGEFVNRGGGECLVQGVLSTAGIHGRELPPEMVAEIEATLQEYKSYRVLRAATVLTNTPLQVAIMAWNDYMGTQKRVAKVLDRVADVKELEYLRAEHVRLTIENHTLQAQITKLSDHITTLEQENNRLKRLTNSFALRADRQQLRELEAELQAKWEELDALPALPA